MIQIESLLKKEEESTGQAPRIPRDSKDCNDIFKKMKMTESEFILKLDNPTVGRPNITYTASDWVFKKAFPVNDRK